MKFYQKVLRLGLLSGLGASLLLTLAPSMGEGQGGDRQIAIISTASGNGEIAPCG